MKAVRSFAAADEALATIEYVAGLGQGSIAVIRDGRDAARARERTAAIEAAAKLDGTPMPTLVLVTSRSDAPCGDPAVP